MCFGCGLAIFLYFGKNSVVINAKQLDVHKYVCVSTYFDAQYATICFWC